jgi:hypothetical protein
MQGIFCLLLKICEITIDITCIVRAPNIAWKLESDFVMINASCILQYGSHSKKRPNNLVIGRTYDHHVYDLVEVGIENFRAMESFTYDKKLAPKEGSKPFMAFIGKGFESVNGLKHLKEVLLDLFRGEVCLRFSFSFTLNYWHLKYINIFMEVMLMILAGCGEFKSCRSGPCICMYCPVFN